MTTPLIELDAARAAYETALAEWRTANDAWLASPRDSADLLDAAAAADIRLLTAGARLAIARQTDLPPDATLIVVTNDGCGAPLDCPECAEDAALEMEPGDIALLLAPVMPDAWYDTAERTDPYVHRLAPPRPLTRAERRRRRPR